MGFHSIARGFLIKNAHIKPHIRSHMGENRIYPRSHRIQTQTKHMKKIVLYQLNILDILQVEKFNHGLRSVRTNLNNILPHM